MGTIYQAHAPLRKIFIIMAEEHPNSSNALKLHYAIKALNDTAGEKGLVPSGLVFGVTPFPVNTDANLRD